MVGDRAPIICNAGASLHSQSRIIVCQHDGTWASEDGSPGLPKCQGTVYRNQEHCLVGFRVMSSMPTTGLGWVSIPLVSNSVVVLVVC